MLIPISLQITDDSGFLAIVNAAKYNSFINEDWELSQLTDRFVDEMNGNNFIIWSTGAENSWTVNFVNKVSDRKSFREFTKVMAVTDAQVYLTNYEDLTMAAAYEDQKIPSVHNADLCIKLANGIYDFKIRQLFNPGDDDLPADDEVSFEVVIQPHDNSEIMQVDKVFWWNS
jgi:hypothetical protein